MPIMRPTLYACALLAAASLPAGVARPQAADELRPPAAFANISDPAERSRALFGEAAKVHHLAALP